MLELKDISFNVQDDSKEKEIIRHLDLNIDDGKFVVVTGPNGGGKSTMAKLIAGIETPTEGKIIFNGEDITGKSITERANLGISFAFQQPARFKGITVLDLLRIAAGKQLTVSACCEFLSEVGLCARDYINREVNASVFERMRTANTRSILIISHQERILQIADEIVVLANGQVTKHGPREEILPELLGTSDAVGVCGCLKRGGANCD